MTVPSQGLTHEPGRTPSATLSTDSLRDDEVRAIADTFYRDDNPLRFDAVRQAALMFERVGYVISRSPVASPLVSPTRTTVGSLVVDRDRRVVLLDNREIILRPREFDLLDLLARHPGQAFSRSRLLDLVWPHDYEGDERTVDVHITRIRRMFGEAIHRPRIIQTVTTIGYKLVPPNVQFAREGAQTCACQRRLMSTAKWHEEEACGLGRGPGP